MRIATESIITEWLWLDKGIIAGCTISVPLFIAAMNLLLGGVIVRFSIDPRDAVDPENTRQDGDMETCAV